MIATQAEENYVKAIYRLSGETKDWVNTNELAKKLSHKPSSVTDMIQRLDQKKLVNYKKYKGVKLTEDGAGLALGTIRKHRLWEVFLHEKLKFSWDEVHDIAEQLEHISSPELVKRLDQFLNFPKYDPHGDPIPDSTGQLQKSARYLISECTEGDHGILVGVNDSSSSFLKFLEGRKLTLGTKFELLKFHEFDNSLDIKLEGKLPSLNISNEVALNLFITKE